MKYIKAPSGKAIVREGVGGRRVSFDGIIVMPIVHRFHFIDTSISNLSLTFQGPSNPVIAKDEQLFDLKVTFLLRIKDTQQDVLDAIDHFEAGNLAKLDDRIPELINDAEQLVRAAAGELTWSEINDTPTFKTAIAERVPMGYFKPGLTLDDIAIDHADKYPPEISASQSPEGLRYREV